MNASHAADLTLVGRKAEREALQARWVRAIDGTPQFVLISGEAGMGRTSLLRAFLTEAEGRGRVLHARCLPVERGPYGPLADLLLQLLGCDEDASPVEISGALDKHLTLLGDRLDHKGLIAHVLRLDVGHPTLAGLSPDGLRQAALSAVGDLIETVATSMPMLIAIEDLHWADPGTAEWLLTCCRRFSLAGSAQRALLVGTTVKGGLTAPLTDLAGITGVGASRFESAELSLGPLSLPETFDLAGRRLGQRAAMWPPPLRNLVKQVLDRAAGHPAYLVETLEALIASRMLVRSAGSWEVASEGVVDLPASVSAALAARLASLPGELRERLQLAAVAGARFDTQLSGTAIEAEIAESLDELVRLRLLSATGRGGEMSEALRDVTYQAIGEERRRQLHLEVGEALEALAGPLAPRFAAELARHFGEARDARRAYRYTCILAERARETALASDAARWYAEALQWAVRLEDLDESLMPPRDLRVRLAQAHTQVGEFDAALATLDELAKEGPLSPEAWRARGTALERHGNMLASYDAIENAVKRSGGDDLEYGRSLLALGDAQRRMGRLADAVATVEAAQTLLGPLATPSEQAMAHGLLGICFRRLGDADRALAEHRKALEIRENAGDLEGVANSLNNVGIILADKGSHREGEDAFGQALALFCRLGNRPGAAMVLNNLGDVYIKEGRLRDAQARLLEAKALAEQLDYASERVTTSANLAEVFMRLGNTAEALRLLERCLSLAVRAGLREFLPEIHAARGRAHAKAGDRALASMAYEEACELAEKAGNEAFAISMREAIASLV